MGTDTTGSRRGAAARGVVALALLAGSAVLASASAGAQTAAEVDIATSASQPTAAPGEDFIFFVSYSCVSLTVPCEGATVTDTVPPELSRAAADVQFGGNFANVNYDPATGAAFFTLFTPLPAGATAQLSITVHFPAGTAPGTVATDRATIVAANAAPVESNAVSVTARAASSWTVTKGQVTGTAQVDTPFTYWVAITLAAGGTQDIGNARILDSLPPGAQFVSASQGGTYDGGTNTVGWQIGTIVASPIVAVTVAPEVTVIFPSSVFQAGDQPVNAVEAFGAPTGHAEQSLGQATFPVVLRGAGAITSASKRSGLGSLGPGQSDTYTLTGGNPNAGALDSFTVLEHLPAALSLVQDGAPNLTGAGTAPQVAWRPLGGGAFQAIGTSAAGGGWGATIPSVADDIQLSYAAVPSGFVASAVVRAGVPASSIGRDGVPVATGSTIRNCVTVSGSSAGTPTIPRSSCTDQIAVLASVRFTKARTSPATVTPGGSVAWEIGIGVEATSAADLVNPVIIDCLPPTIDVVDPNNLSDPVNGSVAGLPAPTLTRGSCGTNQVLLTWTWPGFTLPRGSSGTITLNSRVSTTALPGPLTNAATLASSNLGPAVQGTADVAVTSTTQPLGSISLLKEVNGIDAPNPPGPPITAGAPVVFTYLVTNTGGLTLDHVLLVDDQIGTVTCPRTTLAPGESMTCTTPSSPAISGRYHNVATVTGQPLDASRTNAGPPVTATANGYYTNDILPPTGKDLLPPTGSGTSLTATVGGVLVLVGLVTQALARRRPRPARPA